MIELLARLFIRDSRHTDDPRVRTAYGMLCSAVAITLNILLAAAKFVVGTLAGSVSITADAMNNLSDVGSGALTLQKRLTRLECARLPQEILFAADEAWDIPSEPEHEHEPEPEPQAADDGLDVLWYSAPDGVLTTFDGKRTVIAIPADAPNLPRGAQAVLREIDGRPYLIFPR